MEERRRQRGWKEEKRPPELPLETVFRLNGGDAGSEYAQAEPAAQLFQQPDASQTVSLFVQPGGIDADAHTGRGDRHDAAPHAALAGSPTLTAKSPEPLYMPQVISTALT